MILDNYNSGILGKGMPLGNWTSQFFANIYLDRLDQFVKHELKAKYYLRYVDDFVILHQSKIKLQEYESEINVFLKNLKIELHPDKCKIVPLGRGITFLGFRVFYHYKLIRSRNLRKIKSKLGCLIGDFRAGRIDMQEIFEVLNGWNGYAMQGNMYRVMQSLEAFLKQELKIA